MPIWRKFELKPHRKATWTLSTDPLFIEKTESERRRDA